MTYSVVDFIGLLGALALFLYGMKIMGEGLQKAAGDRMRSILSAMTSNRVFGLLTGVLVTAIIQSSSATTLMVVSFVNAGMLQLAQAISVIMGANIGTTVTAWVISLLGFKVDISAFAVPLLAFALPMIYSKKENLKALGEFVIGFSLLFLGLEYLKTSMPDLQANPEALEFLSRYTNMGFGSVLIFLLIGTVMTLIVQSSSATVALTLVMCSKGWIPFEMATAMVLGENIGTTVTANLAAIGTNVTAKRAAFSHFIFNVIGVILVLVFYYPFTQLVSYLVVNMGQANPNDLFAFVNNLSTQYDVATVTAITSGEPLSDPTLLSHRTVLAGYAGSVSVALSLFHTLFNVCNASVMIWFVPLYVRICNAVIKERRKEKKPSYSYLKFLSRPMLSTADLSILQVQKELANFGERASRMTDMDMQLIEEKNPGKFTDIFNRVEKYENICDNMEIEIATYLTHATRDLLSNETKAEALGMMRIATEIESIGDASYNIARILKRHRDSDLSFSQPVHDNVTELLEMARGSLKEMVRVLSLEDPKKTDLPESVNRHNAVKNVIQTLRTRNLTAVKEETYPYEEGVYYMDIVTEVEMLNSYILNVVEAATNTKTKTGAMIASAN